MKKENKKVLLGVLITAACFILFIACIGILWFNKEKLKETSFWFELQKYKNTIDTNITKDLKFDEYQHNANRKLDLTSGYNDNEPTHPKILNFDEPWNGYKYWIVYSPYPKANDRYENPNLLASNDRVHFETPKGLKNPIEDAPKNYKKLVTYNSDPHLVYNDDKDELEIYYRLVDDSRDEVVIYRLTSKDGVKWSEKEEIIKATRSKKDYISPAIIYDDGVYKMWYVDKNNVVKYAEAKGDMKFEDKKTITLKYPVYGISTWHLDVIKTEKGYEMITVAYRNWDDRLYMNLYYFLSSDNENFEKGKLILRPSINSWDNQGLYRSSFMYDDGKYYVYYAAIRTDGERGVGLSYGENIENLIGGNY